MAKGENIFKRKDGRWEARYIKGYDKNRKIQYGFCYGHSYREAKEKVNHAKLQISHENFPGKSNRKESEKLLTESICISWLEVNRNKLKYSSYSKYKVILEKHLLPEFGLYLISEITSEHIADFTNRLLNQECLAIKTVRDILLLLHAILVYGCEKSNGTFTPVRIVYPKEERKELRVLSQMEQLRLMQYLEKDMDLYKLGVMLAITTGLRVGDDDDKIRLNQRKPSKYKGLRRFGPEKNLQRINKFMKERPIFYKNLIQMKENIRFYLRCFYCITKVMILQFNSENRTELARNG